MIEKDGALQEIFEERTKQLRDYMSKVQLN